MKYFSGVDKYPFLKSLEDTWETILEEYKKVQAHAVAWPEKFLYTDGWTVVGLRFQSEDYAHMQTLCPVTTKIINEIPNVTTAGFSILKAGNIIHPHEGYTDEVYRAHLGLICPEGAWIKVGDEVMTWTEGKVFVFDDTNTHEVQNNSNTDRVILMLDFIKKVYDDTDK
jgi:aspartyl/asparaginyl beta-hydroxylase (cupin superfamily)